MSSQTLRGMLSQPRLATQSVSPACGTSYRCSGSSPAHTPYSGRTYCKLYVKTLNTIPLGHTATKRAFTVLATSDASADLSAHVPGSTSGIQSKSTQTALKVGGAALAFAAAAALFCQQAGYVPAIQEYAANSPLGKSGFLAAFALIFLSELGDKTFFIAALLAMKVGKLLSFAGSVAALSFMTFISVGIGMIFTKVPDQFHSTAPVGQYLGIALLVYFGLKTLKDAWDTPNEHEEGDEGELGAAQVSLNQADVQSGRAWWQAFAQVASLIFVAEWGDRSMLATIALGAAQSPLGVATGAIVGHAIATAIAVVGGALISNYISEKTVGYIGGTLFLVFAVATALGAF